MCPGMAVLGGGGGSGGGSGKGAGSGGGGTGADGEGGAGDASGDGRNGGEGCGDPVCPITGRVFLEVLDFAFPGPMPLRWIRRYSSYGTRESDQLGFAWSHSFGWRVRLKNRRTEVIDDHAKVQRFDKLPVGGEVRNGLGWRLSRHGSGLMLVLATDGLILKFGAAIGDEHRLTSVTDGNGNSIELERDASGHLTGLIDSAGRHYTVQCDRAGRITRIAVALDAERRSYMDVARYEYDQLGDLVLFTDAENHTAAYRYDDHRMVEHRTPGGLSYFYRYASRESRAPCVETWGEYLGRSDPALLEPIPPAPTEGRDRRKVKGIHWVRLTFDLENHYSEVEDGLGGLTRYFGDAQGRVIQKVAPNGGVTTFAYDDESSQPVGVQGPDQAAVLVRRDDAGSSLGFIDPNDKAVLRWSDGEGAINRLYEEDGHAVRELWDSRGNLQQIAYCDGTHEAFSNDHRGLLTTMDDRLGARTRYEHDSMGNLVGVHHPNGGQERSEFDYLGRRVRHTGAKGEVTEWRWDRRNDVVYKKLPNGSEIYLERDPNRKVVSISEQGLVKRFAYGGMGWLVEETAADGAARSYRYDVEGNLVLHRNPRGQEQRWRYDSDRRCVYMSTFEGVEWHASYDQNDNEVTADSPLGRRLTEYDTGHRPTLLEGASGQTIAVEYGATGAKVIDNGVAPIVREYDYRRQLLSERQGAYTTQLAWRGDRLAALGSDVGVSVEYRHDASGQLGGIQVGQLEVSFQGDAGDRVTRFGGGLVLRDRVNANGVLSHRALSRGTGEVPVEQLAKRGDPGLLRTVDYELDARDIPVSERWSDGRTINYELTASGQIAMRTVLDAQGRALDTEKLAYDAAGTPRVAGAHYDSSYRPKSFAGSTFEYDAMGRLERKRTDEGDWLYEWNDYHDLVRVLRPDRVVEMEYDGLGRRVRKKVTRSGEVVSAVSYLWSNNTVLHEKNELDGSTRTYVRDPRTWSPLGHVDVHGGEQKSFLYLTDGVGSIVEAFDDRGQTAWAAERTVYGDYRVTESTVDVSARLPNQHWDEDVGLSYNRYRWYDPRLGVFVSPDPEYTHGSLNPRDYAHNPMQAVDPTGLMPVVLSNNTPHDANGQTRPDVPSAASEVNLHQPGAWATNGTSETPGFVVANDRSRTSMRGITAEQRRQVDAAGTAYGCHSCGRKPKEIKKSDPSWNGHFIPDHQPPKSAVKASDKATKTPPPGQVRLYPHCPQCSRTQGGQCGSETKKSKTCSTTAQARIDNAATVMAQNNP